MAVITVSRQIGSGADSVANRLCQDLGLAVFDKETIFRVATSHGLSEDEIVDYTEEKYRTKGFFAALSGRSRSVADLSEIRESDVGYRRRLKLLDEDWAVGLIRGAVYAAYNRDNALIVGRGGQVILEDRPRAFHVRVVAPMEERIARLRAEGPLSTTEATRFIEQRDVATAEYLRIFYQVDVDDPTLYHLVLNTGRMGEDACVKMIKAGIG